MCKKPVTITINPKIHKEGIEQAKQEKRNFSNYVEWLISEDKKRLDFINNYNYEIQN